MFIFVWMYEGPFGTELLRHSYVCCRVLFKRQESSWNEERSFCRGVVDKPKFIPVGPSVRSSGALTQGDFWLKTFLKQICSGRWIALGLFLVVVVEQKRRQMTNRLQPQSISPWEQRRTFKVSSTAPLHPEASQSEKLSFHPFSLPDFSSASYLYDSVGREQDEAL